MIASFKSGTAPWQAGRLPVGAHLKIVNRMGTSEVESSSLPALRAGDIML